MSFNFNKQNIDHFLYLIAKEYKKTNRYNPNAEIVIVGGASMMLNYNFRDTTTDIDAIIQATSTMKEIVNKVGDENGLETGWLNDDFKKTQSFSNKLIQFSKYYKTFCGCLSVRTVSDEYSIAMKMMSARIYKKDLSDIVGIIREDMDLNKNITFDKIEKAICDLYGDTSKINKQVLSNVKNIFLEKDLNTLYLNTYLNEQINRQALLKADKKYGNIINENNIDNFIKHFSQVQSNIKSNEIDYEDDYYER